MAMDVDAMLDLLAAEGAMKRKPISLAIALRPLTPSTTRTTSHADMAARHEVDDTYPSAEVVKTVSRTRVPDR